MSQRVPGKLSTSSDKSEGRYVDLTMYNPPEWNNVEIKPFKNSFDLQLDALNCGGVPTRTTPTLTPTTLKNIEQMFIELQSDPQTHQNEAGFVPPLLQPSISSSSIPAASSTSTPLPPPPALSHVGLSSNTIVTSNNNNDGNGSSVFMSRVDTKSWQGGCTTVTNVPVTAHSNPPAHLSTIPPHIISVVNNTVAINVNNSHNYNTNNGNLIEISNNTSSNISGPVAINTANENKRNIGGRRPNKENGISPEEEERRQLRRERNKLAAARCRKRRLDHTNQLVEETGELEGKKQRLHEEIRQLQIQKEELEFLLDAHRSCCRVRYTESPEDVKPYILTSSDDVKPYTLSPPLSSGESHQLTISPAITTAAAAVTTTVGDMIVKDESDKRHFEQSKVLSVSSGGGKVRPNSLPVVAASNSFIPKLNRITIIEAANTNTTTTTDIPITTPSAGLGLNFESLLEGGTGYTPITPSSLVSSCAIQQRNSDSNNADLISPDTVPSKLVSL